MSTEGTTAVPATPRRKTAGRRGANRRTPEQMLDAIRAWVERYDEPPTIADWEPSRARRLGQAWRVERFAEGGWPSARMVSREFGTFGAAVAAAGFEPRRARTWGLRADGPLPILDAIREWASRYGQPPIQADWDPVHARLLGQEWRAVRFQAGRWPSTAQVRHAFGSLGAAIEAAGFVPQRRGDTVDADRDRRDRNRVVIAAQSVGEPVSNVGAALAGGLRAVQRARVRGDDAALRAALLELAGVALAAAEHASADDY